MTPPALELTGIVKNYHGLRPLRMERLIVGDREAVAVLGLDQPAAEVLTNLITGAALPDQGEVKLFGRPTSDITDSADWLATVDRIGIISERAVLLDGHSVIQNLCIPFSLEIEPPPEEVRVRAQAIAQEVHIDAHLWDRRVADVDSTARVRVLAGRALALDPGLLLVEHASARVPRLDVNALGTSLRGIAHARGAALVALTADPEFAAACAGQVLTLEPATGRLKGPRGSRWFDLFQRR